MLIERFKLNTENMDSAEVVRNNLRISVLRTVPAATLWEENIFWLSNSLAEIHHIFSVFLPNRVPIDKAGQLYAEAIGILRSQKRFLKEGSIAIINLEKTEKELSLALDEIKPEARKRASGRVEVDRTNFDTIMLIGEQRIKQLLEGMGVSETVKNGFALVDEAVSELGFPG
jgi:hypothetical protein